MPENTQESEAIKEYGVVVEPDAVVNEILPFCAQGQVGRDLLSQAEYASDMQRNIGHQPGIARAMLANKHARQTAHMAAGLAQFLSRRYAPGVLDDGDLDKIEAALVAGLKAVFQAMDLPLATTEIAGLVQIGRGLAITGDGCVEVKPDPATLAISSQGALTALGGNLAYNEEVWILASGTFTAPVTGWYEIAVWHGGGGGMWSVRHINGYTGNAYAPLVYFRYYNKGALIPVVIGAGGLGGDDSGQWQENGGITTFGDLPTEADRNKAVIRGRRAGPNLLATSFTLVSGIGVGGAEIDGNGEPHAPTFYGAS